MKVLISTRVVRLVIPEDFRKDQFVKGPIITAMMSAVGKPKKHLYCTKK